MKDYYKTLGISRTATSSEIKIAYRKLSMLYHPDRNNGEEKFNGLFAELNEAYQTLYKEETRNRYDRLWNNKDSQPQSSYRSYQQEQSYIQPIITQFFVDKIYFKPGEIVTITWNTSNADSIELKPFGFVGPQGVKKIKFNQSNLYIDINIVALNTVSRRYYTSKITLENITHPLSKNAGKSTAKPIEKNTEEKSMLHEIFSLEGSLNRLSYITRVGLIGLIYLIITPILMLFSKTPETFKTLIIIFVIIITIIQSVKRLTALKLSWFFCIFLLIPYLNIVVLLLLCLLPNSKKTQ